MHRLQQRSFVRHHVSHQPLISGLVFPNHRHRLTHRRMALQRCLDLAQLDAVAAQLDLVVDAAKVFDVAILDTARQIAAAVKPGPRCGAERVGNEALRGELGAVEIAARNTRAA